MKTTTNYLTQVAAKQLLNAFLSGQDMQVLLGSLKELLQKSSESGSTQDFMNPEFQPEHISLCVNLLQQCPAHEQIEAYFRAIIDSHETHDVFPLSTIQLNLGCGHPLLPGYVNVDKYGEPDILYDLEKFPWPWSTNSVSEILLSHILECLGQNTATFKNIMQEIYRICINNAKISIKVSHPNHDCFSHNPLNIRIITPELLSLLSKKNCDYWKTMGTSTSPLAHYWNVDFDVINTIMQYDEPWKSKIEQNQISKQDLEFALKHYRNIVYQIDFELVVKK